MGLEPTLPDNCPTAGFLPGFAALLDSPCAPTFTGWERAVLDGPSGPEQCACSRSALPCRMPASAGSRRIQPSLGSFAAMNQGFRPPPPRA